MTPSEPTILILGGTGKTGRRLAQLLRRHGSTVRTAARVGADVTFGWTDPASHDEALEGADRIYLVPPPLRLDFAPAVISFLDRAQRHGVAHVVFLSARGVEFAPPETAMRAVELDLAGRSTLTHTILRPAFFAQNFTEGAFAEQVRSGTLTLPAGDGVEAFIDVQDIASAAAAILLDPAAHSGAHYELTGPQALTHAEVVHIIAARTGRAVQYVPVPARDWIAAAAASGLPHDYAEFLAALLEGIAAGHGARPSHAVEQITGRPATGLEHVVARELGRGRQASSGGAG